MESQRRSARFFGPNGLVSLNEAASFEDAPVRRSYVATCGRAGVSSIEATMRQTRPALIAAAFRRAAWARITEDRSIPTTCPRVVRRAISRSAMPGPNPISRTRSEGCTSNSETAQTLRFLFEGRSAISHPTRRPGNPRGLMN